jgi:hypothetical protein
LVEIISLCCVHHHHIVILVVVIFNRIFTATNIKIVMMFIPAVYWCTDNILCYLAELDVLEMIYMYIHKLNYKIRRVWWKNKVFVRNQVINYHFKMIRLYDTVIVLNIVVTNWRRFRSSCYRNTLYGWWIE